MLTRVNRPALPAALLLAGLLAVSGCGGDDSPAPAPTPAALGTASVDPIALPTGWPAVAFPEGTDILSADTGTDAGGPRLSVTFDTTQLASAVIAFLDDQLTAAGFSKAGTRTTGEGATISYTGTGQSATLEVTDATTVT
ncbi:MAG: hypothetical protein JWO46_15, partial [Nocardioidaceae bacterium]|nr:hypothetical protein [Nocardioidaceae bacterium]